MEIAPCKGIQDSIGLIGFYAVDTSLSVELRFRIPIVSGIPGSLPDVFRIPKPRIPDCTRKNFPDSGIQTPLYGANGLVWTLPLAQNSFTFNDVSRIDKRALL